MSEPRWEVGWSSDGRKFYFRSPSGFVSTVSGRKAPETARALLAAYLPIAESAAGADSDPEFIAAIKAVMALLGGGGTP